MKLQSVKLQAVFSKLKVVSSSFIFGDTCDLGRWNSMVSSSNIRHASHYSKSIYRPRQHSVETVDILL